jgi:anti-sigma B factor antagonist
MKTIGKKGRLVICGVKETVMRLFQLTRMDRVFQIFPSQHEAIRAITD